MKRHGDNSVSMSAALLAQVQAAAREEHRPADELVRDAVRRYLERRRLPAGEAEAGTQRKNLVQLLLDSPFAGAELNLERRKDYTVPLDL